MYIESSIYFKHIHTIPTQQINIILQRDEIIFGKYHRE